VQAGEDDAVAILKAMSDYVAGQSNIELTFDSAIEVITPELEKIQFTNSGEALLSRPDRLRVHRMGGYSDVAMYFDGKTVSVYGRHLNAYAQFEGPASVDQLIEALRAGHGVALPGADSAADQRLQGPRCGRLGGQAHRAGHYRWPRVRASGLPQLRHRLAALGGGG